jgi:LmbE family N-acetylglucosaminyl deacetylase
MDWVYLSPHLDDVALSCGGLVWEQVHAKNRVDVWTICAGDPPPGSLSPFAQSLHKNWGVGLEAANLRRREDIDSCAHLGAEYRHFLIPDCIYRRDGESGEHLYTSEETLWGDIHPADDELIERLCRHLERAVPENANLVCPLTLGDHVDHCLTRAAAEQLNRPLWYYADFPYVLHATDQLTGLRESGWRITAFNISKGGLCAWEDSIAAHTSQISTFWPNLESMRIAIQEYHQKLGGISLWQRP